MTRSELYQALRAATEGEFDLVGELDADQGWMAYLAQARSGEVVILLLHHTEENGEFDLQVVDALDGSLAVGRTHCPACGAAADGWPRFCGACRRDLSGVEADTAIPGGSAADLLDAVREASAGVYEVLGAMRRAEGGGAMYFAREVEGGRIAGLVLERDKGADLALVRAWGVDEDALARPVPFAALHEQRLTGPPTPEPDFPPATEVEDAPLPLLADAPLRQSRRPTRGLLYPAGGGLLVAAGVALAFVLVQRDPVPIVPGDGVDSLRRTPAPALPTSTLPTDTAPLSDSAAPPPAEKGSDAAPDPPAKPRRPRDTLPPRSAPKPEDAPPATVEPSPEIDRQRVMEAVARYAAAVESRDVERVREAYPDISTEEAEQWTTWFGRLPRETQLRVTHAVSDEPVVNGDTATVVFTLTIRYHGQRRPLTSHATLRRVGDGWTLSALRKPD